MDVLGLPSLMEHDRMPIVQQLIQVEGEASGELPRGFDQWPDLGEQPVLDPLLEEKRCDYNYCSVHSLR